MKTAVAVASLWVSGEQLAAVFGVDGRTIRKWRSAGAPAARQGAYDLVAWYAWRHGEGTAVNEQGETRQEAERRRAIARATLEELKLAKERGETVDRAEADRRRMRVLDWALAAMDRAASELPTVLAGQPPAKTRALVADYFAGVRKGAVHGNKGR